MAFVRILIFIVTCLLGGNYSQATPFGDMIRDLLKFDINYDVFSKINEKIQGHLSSKSIEYVLPNKIKFKDLTVLDHEKKEVLFGKEVEISLSLVSLLTKNIIVKEAFVDGVRFNYNVSKKLHNVVEAFSPKNAGGENSDIKVTIEHVVAQNGFFSMIHDSGVQISASGIKAEGDFWVMDGPFGVNISKAEIKEGVIVAGGITMPIKELVTHKLFISDEKVSTASLEAMYEDSPLKGQGTVYIEQEKFDIDATLDRTSEKWPIGLKPLFFSPPKFKAKVNISGSLTSPIIKAQVDTQKSYIKGIQINPSSIDSVITEDGVKIVSSKINIERSTAIIAKGQTNFNKQTYDFETIVSKATLSKIGKVLGYNVAEGGVFTGKLGVKGKYGTDESILFQGGGSLIDPQFGERKLDGTSRLKLNIEYDFKRKVEVRNLTLEQGKFFAKGFGLIDPKEENLEIFVEAKLPDAKHIYPYISSSIKGRDLSFKGKVKKSKEGTSIDGSVDIKELEYQNFFVRNIAAKVNLEPSKLQLDVYTARVGEGGFGGNIKIFDIWDKKELKGEWSLNSVNLRSFFADALALDIDGTASVKGEIRGDLDNPVFSFGVSSDYFSVQKIPFGKTYWSSKCTLKECLVKELYSQAMGGLLSIRKGKYDFKKGSFSLKSIVEGVNFGDLFLGQPMGQYVKGVLSGNINVSGNSSSFKINSDLNIKNSEFFGVKVGGGNIKLFSLEDNVIRLAASLKEKEESTLLGAFDLSTKKFNTKLGLNRVVVNNFLHLQYFPDIGGIFSGNVEAYGDFSNPTIDGKVIFEEVWLKDHNEKTEKSSFGPWETSLTLKDKKLKIDSCGVFSRMSTEKSCSKDMDARITLKGFWDWNQFSLNYAGYINPFNVVKFIGALKKDFLNLSLSSEFQGEINKKTNQTIDYTGQVKINSLFGSSVSLPQIALKESIFVGFNSRKLWLEAPAKFQFFPGELEIGGALAKENSEIRIDGDIPLALGKVFSPGIQMAKGLVKGNLTLRSQEKYWAPQGTLGFARGGILSFSKNIEPIEFYQGELSLETVKDKIIIKAKNIEGNVGYGSIHLDGSYHWNLGKDDRENDEFNIRLSGGSIRVKSGGDIVDGNFDLFGKKNQEENKITGKVNISSGAVKRKFDLRNFIANIKGVDNYDLSLNNNLATNLDVQVDVAQFNIAAQILNFSIDTLIVGQMRLKGNLSKPKFFGDLFIRRGEIKFPAATFDLSETQVPLNEHSDAIFDPKIELTSMAELSKEQFPLLGQNTTIELAVVGDGSKLNFRFRPVYGDTKLSQLKIFLLLLSSSSGAALDEVEEQKAVLEGAKRAALTLSGAVFLDPLSKEVQELLQGKTGSQIQFGSSLNTKGVNISLSWKPDERINLFANYLLSNSNREKKYEMEDGLSFEEEENQDFIRANIFLIDHKPFGPLFLQTNFSSRSIGGKFGPRGDVKIIYRVLNQ